MQTPQKINGPQKIGFRLHFYPGSEILSRNLTCKLYFVYLTFQVDAQVFPLYKKKRETEKGMGKDIRGDTESRKEARFDLERVRRTDNHIVFRGRSDGGYILALSITNFVR